MLCSWRDNDVDQLALISLVSGNCELEIQVMASLELSTGPVAACEKFSPASATTCASLSAADTPQTDASEPFTPSTQVRSSLQV